MDAPNINDHERLKAIEQLYRRCARRYKRDADKAAAVAARLIMRSDADYHRGIAEGLSRAAAHAINHADEIIKRINRELVEWSKHND